MKYTNFENIEFFEDDEMKILIAESGQHVIEAAKYYAQMGHEVILALPEGRNKLPKVFYSRHISYIVRYTKDMDDFSVISRLKMIYETEGCDVFYPFGFNLVTRYLSVIQEFPECKMNTPYRNGEGYWSLSDKNELYNTASGTSVCVPMRSGLVRSKDISSLEIQKFPVIVKRTQGVGIIDNVCLAWDQNDISTFISLKNSLNGSTDEFLIQEYIPGDVYDVGGFAVEGELYYAVPQRRTVTLPLRGGVAAVNDIYPDSHLIELASEVIKAAKWTGPFQAEFRWNPKDNKYYLIEVNAKMWGSTPLSLLSNPDILTIALDVAIGKEPQKSLKYKRDLRFRWICYQELLAISKGDVKDILQFFSRFAKKSCYDFNLNDPIPCLMRFIWTLHKVIFKKDKIPKSLINRREHERLNSK